MLAWDIAWLCKTQGIDSVTTFDDVCNMGKNLHQLFLATSDARPPIIRNVSAAITTTERSKAPAPDDTARLGSFSHASAYKSLSSAAGQDLVRGWRLASPARLVDKLKSYLLNEISGAEWDFLSGEEWDEEREEDAPVLVGGARRSLDRHGPALSVISVRPSDGADDIPMPIGKTNGWMKVRGRGGET